MIGYNEGKKLFRIFFLTKINISWELMNLNDYSNMKHADSFCPICKTSEISLYDEYHGETFCAKCGLVLHRQDSRKSAVEYINEARETEQSFRRHLNQQLK